MADSISDSFQSTLPSEVSIHHPDFYLPTANGPDRLQCRQGFATIPPGQLHPEFGGGDETLRPRIFAPKGATHGPRRVFDQPGGQGPRRFAEVLREVRV